MTPGKRWILSVIMLLIFGSGAFGQKKKESKTAPKTDPTKQHEQKVRDMVAFFAYVLNTIGNAGTDARDKDVLITESYSKIFRDSKVQVEDDLVEKRNVVTNKDVTAYLKDVDFFFKDVHFEFDIEKIQGKVNANQTLFYKVSLKRNIKGTTIEGKAINNTIPRFIEINYDPKVQDLKIVSIYTHEFNEKTAWLSWWKGLSHEWQAIFKRKLNLVDSVQLDDIQDIASIESLDLSNNEFIVDIEPLSQLTSLKLLSLSGTKIKDLSPVRNLTELLELDLSRTSATDFNGLRYSDRITSLNLNGVPVEDISVLEKMTSLEKLDLGETSVVDFAVLNRLPKLKSLNLEGTSIVNLAPIGSLAELTELKASRTKILDLSPITGFYNLVYLNVDSTRINNISPVINLQNLRILSVNATGVKDLNPLKGLRLLEKVYCDHTPINAAIADAFMAARPGVLVVFDSEDLRIWWKKLSPGWKQTIQASAKMSADPAKEELARVTLVDSINIEGKSELVDLEPLRKIPKLRVLIAGGTGITSLLPLKDHRDIEFLDINNTGVSDISTVSSFKKLTILKADQSKIQEIDQLAGVKNLKTLYVDNTFINEFHVQEFLGAGAECLVVYKTSHLEKWWDELSDDWKEVFKRQVTINPATRREDLHKLVELKSISFADVGVADLSVLKEFIRLQEIQFSGTPIADLSPLSGMANLKTLHATNSPIRNLEALFKLTTLEDVSLSETPIDDLRPLANLKGLKKFNCAGTQIKSLDVLQELQNLELLDCSNTNVKQLDPVEGLPLKTLRCFNTRITDREVEKFKATHPECNVIYYR
jgi:Leucine-rich repeat (LRR) protein